MALGGYYTQTVLSNSYHKFVVFSSFFFLIFFLVEVFSSLGITKDAKDEKFFGQCNETCTKAFPDHKCQLDALEDNELQLVPSVTIFASVSYYSKRQKTSPSLAEWSYGKE